ncbi:TPM domain-containing protein [Hyalangium gracile]|uniref:TPM domain-containing protein n=1 Tax=Hyalangium gracile TaxID=394092 RepID=UPI001CCB4425|nr:TPM domain-containing protein [Hyalangium gracile]
MTATESSLRAWVARVLVVPGLLLWALGTPAWGETVASLSRSPRSPWVVDGTGGLDEGTRAELNRLGTEVDQSGLGQLLFVVVATTEGRPPRTFGTELFNRWKLGHSRRNDGVLLLVALLDRKAEIILGDGVDTPADVTRSEVLMQQRIIPALKRRQIGEAMLEGGRGLKALLAQAPLNEGMGRVMDRPTPVTGEPAKPRAKEPPPVGPEPKEFLDDEGMYVDLRTSSASGDEETAGSSSGAPRPSSSSAGGSGVTVHSSVSPWVWAVVGGFILFLLVANALRRRGVACESCGSTSVKVSTSTLLPATDGSDGLVEVTVRCRRCGHVGTSAREVSSRRRSRSHHDTHGGGHSSGRGASGNW